RSRRFLPALGLFFIFINRSRGSVERKEYVQPRAVAHRKDAGSHFVDGVFLDLVATFEAVGESNAGKDQAQVVVNFGGGRYSRARVPRRVLLGDGNGRGDAVDQVRVWLLNALQKLPRIGR